VPGFVEYVHPAFMVVTLSLVLLALRQGLILRRARAGGDLGGRTRGERRALHLRFGKLAIGFLVVGFLGGLGTTTFVQGETPLSTAHGLLGSLSLLSFGAVARLGGRLEQGDVSGREAHAWTAMVAVLLAATGAVAGFVLLP
jgi:hypothetical protein